MDCQKTLLKQNLKLKKVDDDMETKLNQKKLKKILTIIKTISNKWDTGIENSLIFYAKNKELHIAFSDLENFIRINLRTTVELKQPVSVNLTIFHKAITNLDGNCKMVFKESSIVLLLEKNKNTELPATKFENLTDFNEDLFKINTKYATKKKVKVRVDKLLEKIEKVIFAVDVGNSRYAVFNGISFEKNNLVATNGKIIMKTLHSFPFAKKNFEDVVIPLKSINVITKLLTALEEKEVTIIQEHYNETTFKGKDLIVSCKNINGKFINYNQIIPTKIKASVCINAKKNLKDLKKIAKFVDPPSGLIKLCNNGSFKVKYVSEQSETEIQIDTIKNIEEFEVGINIRFLNGMLEKMNSNSVNLCVTSDISPIIVLTDNNDESFTGVIVSMKL